MSSSSASKDDARNMMRAAIFLVNKAIKDKVLAVYTAGLNLLKMILTQFIQEQRYFLFHCATIHYLFRMHGQQRKLHQMGGGRVLQRGFLRWTHATELQEVVRTMLKTFPPSLGSLKMKGRESSYRLQLCTILLENVEIIWHR
jgi:hypothetical protein